MKKQVTICTPGVQLVAVCGVICDNDPPGYVEIVKLPVVAIRNTYDAEDGNVEELLVLDDEGYLQTTRELRDDWEAVLVVPATNGGSCDQYVRQRALENAKWKAEAKAKVQFSHPHLNEKGGTA